MAAELGFKCNPSVVNSSAPPIPAAALWASRYKPTSDRSSKLINLSQGVPGSPPPPELLERLAEEAADPSTTGYGPIAGDAALKEALVGDLNAAYGAEGKVKVENVAITAGCNLAFYSTILALCQKGDEVILPTPWYFNHEMTLTQLGVTIVSLACDPATFLPSAEACASLISPKTRAIIIVTPNNPTGAVYPPSLIRQLSELAQANSLPLIIDETYRDFLPPSIAPHDRFTLPDWASSTIQLSSFSKSYAIPGHRLGSIVASPVFLTQVMKTLDCLQINPPRVAQKAVAWAIEGIRPWRGEQREALERRQELFRELLDGTGWEVKSGSAYFAMVQHPFEARSEVVARRLASRCGVITLPGSFFSPALAEEQDRFIRFSVANVLDNDLKLVRGRLLALNEMWTQLDD